MNVYRATENFVYKTDECIGRGATGDVYRGVHKVRGQSTIVFVTVCTKDRKRWSCSDEIHRVLLDEWLKARAWLVGRYVIMPDHIHLFAAPGEIDLPIERWCGYWKRNTSTTAGLPAGRWQKNGFHSRMRSQKQYEEKWIYVRNNPVRHKLVEQAGAWPYQGELFEFRW